MASPTISLPEELLDHFLTFCTQSALTHLCLVSKQFNRLATPHIYGHIVLSHDGSHNNYRYLWPVTFLLRTSTRHATMARSLTLRKSYIDSEEYPPLRNSEFEWERREKLSRTFELLPWPHYQDLDSTLKRWVQQENLKRQHRDNWYRDLVSGTTDVSLIALLLCGLPKLRWLQLSRSFSREDELYLSWLFRPTEPESRSKLSLGSLALTARFDCLTELVLCGHCDDCFPPFSVPALYLGAAMLLPCLRRLYGHHVRSILFSNTEVLWTDYGDGPVNNSTPGSAGLEHLELRSSLINNADLACWLQVCKPGSLKSFIYEMYPWFEFDDTTPYKRIMHALGPHIATLDTLSITQRTDYSDNSTFTEQPPEMNNMRFNHFTSLRRLRLAPDLIWGTSGVMSPPTYSNSLLLGRFQDMLWRSIPATLCEFRLEYGLPFIEMPTAQQGYYHRNWTILRFHLGPALYRLATRRLEFCPKLNTFMLESFLHFWPKDCIVNVLSGLRTLENVGVSCTLKVMGICESHSDPIMIPPQRGWGWDENIQLGKCMFNVDSSQGRIEIGSHNDLQIMELLQSFREQEIESARFCPNDYKRLRLHTIGAAFGSHRESTRSYISARNIEDTALDRDGIRFDDGDCMSIDLRPTGRR